MLYYFSFFDDDDLKKDLEGWENFKIQNIEIKEAKFYNNEFFFQINNLPSNANVFLNFSHNIFDSEFLIKIALIIDTIKNLTENIIIYIPYIPYDLQSNYSENSSFGINFVKKILNSKSVKKIITVESHTNNLEKIFSNTEVINIPFIKYIVEYDINFFEDKIVILPDKGAFLKYDKILTKNNIQNIVFEKTRNFSGGIKFQNINKKNDIEYKKFIFMDDIILSGKTFQEIQKIIKLQFKSEIDFCISAKIFNQNICKNNPNVRFITSDAIKVFSKNMPNLKINKLSKIILEIIKREKLI